MIMINKKREQKINRFLILHGIGINEINSKKMRKYDLITVICPVYNQQDCLNNYIKTLRLQTYGFSNMQVILINDGSTDLSGDICARFAKKYKNVIYIEQENKGVSAARNAGLKVADGKYIFYLDADDLISKNTIADCVNEFDKIYDQVDLLTYPIVTYYKGMLLKPDRKSVV